VVTLYGNFKRELADFIASHEEGHVIQTEEVHRFFDELKQKKEVLLKHYL
jgi:dethiobiotin synthetase